MEVRGIAAEDVCYAYASSATASGVSESGAREDTARQRKSCCWCGWVERACKEYVRMVRCRC